MKANLYWVTSAEPEDWFIVAPSVAIAAECHECGEGLNKGDAKAELICEIPSVLEVEYRKSEYDVLEEGYWPSLKLLEALGFQFIEKTPPYIVKRNARVFYQGESVYALMLANLIHTGVYIVNIRNTNKYKIGYTKDIKRRLNDFKTSNPFPIDLHFYVVTEKVRLVERKMHTLLAEYRTVREWFEIDDRNKLTKAIENINVLYNVKTIDTTWLIGI